MFLTKFIFLVPVPLIICSVTLGSKGTRYLFGKCLLVYIDTWLALAVVVSQPLTSSISINRSITTWRSTTHKTNINTLTGTIVPHIY